MYQALLDEANVCARMSWICFISNKLRAASRSWFQFFRTDFSRSNSWTETSWVYLSHLWWSHWKQHRLKPREKLNVTAFISINSNISCSLIYSRILFHFFYSVQNIFSTLFSEPFSRFKTLTFFVGNYKKWIYLVALRRFCKTFVYFRIISVGSKMTKNMSYNLIISFQSCHFPSCICRSAFLSCQQ